MATQPTKSTRPVKWKNAFKEVTDEDVLRLMEIFQYSYTKSLNSLGRLQEFQNMFDNVIDDSLWPSKTKMPMPILFSTVYKKLPEALDYLFPRSMKVVKLNPRGYVPDMEAINRAEWALQDMVTNKMKIQSKSLPILQDCFKLSVGFGIVEPILVTPPAVFRTMVFRGDKQIVGARTIGKGAPQKSLRLRWISPGQIIVTPDGNDFNGDQRVSCGFYFDLYREDEFMSMFKNAPKDGENNSLMIGDPEEIVAQAKALAFDGRADIVDMVASLGGIDIKETNTQAYNDHIPAQIPVLKCYEPHCHTWIANGTTKIFYQEDDTQTLRTPLIRCSAWPDGGRFYPMSDTEAAQKIALGKNVWMGLLMDLLTKLTNPELVYDKTATNGKIPERGPDGMIGVAGKVGEVAAYLQPPNVPQIVGGIGEYLQQAYSDTVGQNRSIENSAPGLMRGGLYAFESLLQTISGRSRLAGAVLETNFLLPTIEQVLIYMQMNMPPEGMSFNMRKWSPETGKEYIDQMSVTEEDLVNAFDLELDLSEKSRKSASDINMRLSKFAAFKDDKYTNQVELRNITWGDDTEAHRLFVPTEKGNDLQKQEVAMQMRERAAAVAPQETAMPQIPAGMEQASAGMMAATGQGG